jgi:hypothetical protein
MPDDAPAPLTTGGRPLAYRRQREAERRALEVRTRQADETFFKRFRRGILSRDRSVPVWGQTDLALTQKQVSPNATRSGQVGSLRNRAVLKTPRLPPSSGA